MSVQLDIFDLLAEDSARGRLKPVCERCDHRHVGTDARAVGRFQPGGPIGYRADYPGALLRPTRELAMHDACDHRTTTTPREDEHHA